MATMFNLWYTVALVMGFGLGVWKVPVLRFIFSVLYFGWISISLCFFIHPISKLLTNHKGSVTSHWAPLCNWFFDIKYTKEGDGQLEIRKPIMYILPHRTWADFFIHRHVTGSIAAQLSRYLVGAIFPLFMLIAFFDSSCLFFKRDAVKKDTFFPWILSKLQNSTMSGIINYAEGTRNTKMDPKPLRRGAIYFAYEFKVPIQVIMTQGHDDVITEKRLSVKIGNHVRYRYGNVFDPRDFETRELFFDAVQEHFNQLFYQMYNPAKLLEASSSSSSPSPSPVSNSSKL